MTYRWKEHVGPNEDFQLGYRTPDEAEPWIRNDQVAALAQLLPDGPRRAPRAGSGRGDPGRLRVRGGQSVPGPPSRVCSAERDALSRGSRHATQHVLTES